MAYKFQRGAATLSGSVTIEETLSVTGVSTLSALLSSSAKISGSSFWGDGSGLTNISSDNVDVTDSSAASEFRLVGVAASGDGVTLTCMDTEADRITMNAQTGKLSIAGALDVDGAATLNGNVTLGDAVTDVSTVTGYLTASKGIRLSNVSWIAANTPFHFSGEGGSAKVKGDGSNNLSLMGATLVSNAASFAPESAGGISLGTTSAELGHVYLADDKKIQFGSGQDATIEYDEDGTDELRFAGAAATFEQAVSFDDNVTLGLDGGDITTVTGHLTASKGGKFTLGVDCDSTLNVDGNFTANADVTLGNAGGDLIGITGHLTASKGGLFSNHVQIADGKRVVFNGDGQIRFQNATTNQSAISLTDNLASALLVGQGATTYMTFKTSNGAEAIIFGQDVDCDGALNVDGALTANGTVTLGNAASDVITVSGHLTASKGGLFSQNVQIATGKELKFVGNAAIDMSSAATGQAYISMADNLAEGFFIAQGANTYLTCVTSNSSEAVVAGKELKVGASVGTDVHLSLYSGVEYHGQELVTGNKTISEVNRSHYICSGSGVITLTLPAAATGYSTFVKRHPSMSNNVKIAANGSQTIDGATTDLHLETAGAAVQLVASGSAWYVY